MESVLRNNKQEEAMDALVHLEEWDGETYQMIWDELRKLAKDDSDAWFAFGRMMQTFFFPGMPFVKGVLKSEMVSLLCWREARRHEIVRRFLSLLRKAE